MKKLSTAIVIAIIALVAFSSAYTVDEAEQVVIVQLGKVVGDAVMKPGLHFKIPLIQEARRFEKRWLEWDGDANQTTTRDKRYIYIDVFARWRIDNPLLFIKTLRDEMSAQGRLDDIIDNATRNVIANHNLIEAIRTTNRVFAEPDDELLLLSGGTQPTEEREEDDQTPPPKKEFDRNPNLYRIVIGREKLTRLILEKASQKATQLGIDIKDVQIKRINYIESVQEKVFDRMISERKRVAEAFRSQGQGLSAEILGKMEKELKTIRSGAYRKTQEIMGRADAEAAAIYAEAYRVNPELYGFLKTMESYEKTVDKESWLLLTTNADYTRYLQGMKRSPR